MGGRTKRIYSPGGVLSAALALALVLTACGGSHGTTDTENAGNAAEREEADVGEVRDLTEVGESASESESLCAVAYCGTRNGYSDALAAFEHLRLSEKYPDLSEISVLDTGGNEFYVLVPSSDAVSVVVEGYGMDEDGNAGPDGEIFYDEDGSPVVLLCNVSDIIPDTQVTVTDDNGDTLIFSPSLSLEDGKLYAPGTVDFTDYDWAARNG